MITIITPSRYKLGKKFIKNKAQELSLQKGISENNEINIVFVGKIKMKQLTLKYKKENQEHPVLTFKYNDQHNNNKILGEIIICYPYAVLLAAERNKKVDDMIIQLIDHGLKNLTD